MIDDPWDYNEHGAWCNSCGELVGDAEEVESKDWSPPLECRCCGFPEDIEKMAEFHGGED